ncbi:hypothetical protein H072_5094 [Dactylellina haptotyla CBS 200.50]|uniref:Uncharacterized protein n=1 Tax=Dactylellina haptotyla (strain CBS 200.50) TaxID=1284197 RepID=S8BNH4_DACHA|nr:hypothetical protein H072_5094 [Dactylellina haptotyla CBS 200.50]
MIVSTPIAVALLQVFTLFSEVSAHAKPIWVWGSNKKDVKVPGFGVDRSVPLGGQSLHPYQFDVPVFSSPVVPNPKVPRVWLSQGCGSTVGIVDAYWSKHDRGRWSGASLDSKNWWYYAQYIPNDLSAYIPQRTITANLAKANKLPTVYPGGALVMQIYTVNQDGAGPFRCRIDETGDGNHFGNWLGINPKYQVPPLQTNLYSVLYSRIGQMGYIQIDVPRKTVCRGSYGGVNNICMVRCENYAKNGPFGGCMAFQLLPPKGTPTTTMVSSIDKTTVIVSDGQTETVTVPTTVTVTAPVQTVEYVTISDEDEYSVPTQTGNPGYNINGGKPEYRYKKRSTVDEEGRTEEMEKREIDHANIEPGEYFEKRAFNPEEMLNELRKRAQEDVEKRDNEEMESPPASKNLEREAKLLRRIQDEPIPSDEEMMKQNQVGTDPKKESEAKQRVEAEQKSMSAGHKNQI